MSPECVRCRRTWGKVAIGRASDAAAMCIPRGTPGCIPRPPATDRSTSNEEARGHRGRAAELMCRAHVRSACMLYWFVAEEVTRAQV